jgi:hypothetical protein
MMMRAIKLIAFLAACVQAAVDFKSVSVDLISSAITVFKTSSLSNKYGSTMKDMHHAIKLLTSLNVSGLQSQCGSSCDEVVSAFKAATSSLDLYYAYSVASTCGCKNIKFNTRSLSIIDEDLEVHRDFYCTCMYYSSYLKCVCYL